MRRDIRNARIKVFNSWWWLYVIATFAVLVAVTLIGRGMETEGRYRFMLILSIIELIVLRIYKFSLKNIRADYNYFNELPCYLCNQATLLCIAAALLKSQVLMSYCASIGTLGAVLAFVMPDSYNRDQPVFSSQAYGFYGYHGLLIVTCLSFYTLGLYQPRLTDCLWAGAITAILTIIAHLVNVWLRTNGLNKVANYVFTYTPDNFLLQKLYDRFPVRLFYLLPALPLLMLLALGLLAIMKAF